MVKAPGFLFILIIIKSSKWKSSSQRTHQVNNDHNRNLFILHGQVYVRVHLRLYLWRSIQQLDTQKWEHSIAFGFHREFYGRICLLKRVQEVRCCFYIGHDGERIVNISSIERREFTLSLRFSSMWDMNTLANKGPRGDPITTPSVCSYKMNM